MGGFFSVFSFLKKGRAMFKKKAEKEFFKMLQNTNKIIPYDGSSDPYHTTFPEFLAQVNMEKKKVLEIGSRNVTEEVRSQLFNQADYTGFDVLEGENVHVVGDAHELSSYFPAGDFDGIFSISVFEHLLMPWKVILEINKVLKNEGIVFISTHPAWAMHELPWDFWRFQKNSFHALLNKYTGFEILKIEEGLPCRIISMVNDPPTRNLINYPANLGVSVIAKKVCDYDSNLQWNIPLHGVIDTMYPKK